ncbi:hypothetical protein KEM54_001589 [Ascosphaera aggregata]|nr:hypothetical protein KEM54_001589 [Ascosphaera aggregata]
MFSMPRSLDVITLFHNPSLRSSLRALNLLERASALAQEASCGVTFDSSNPSRGIPVPGNEFELEVTTKPPTKDQLNSILDFLGGTAAVPGKASDIVQGARDREDAIRKVMADGSKFIRPVVVDWSNGKAVLGGNEPRIIKMLKELPQ